MAKPLAQHTVESIMARTVEEGDCALWTGYAQNRTPQIYDAGRMVPVRGLLSRLLGREEPKERGYWASTCGSDLCVKNQHTTYRTDSQHYAYMAKRMQTMPAVQSIRRAKISKARTKKLTDDQVHEILHSNESSRVVAERVGISKSLVCRYRRGELGGTIATNMFMGLIQ